MNDDDSTREAHSLNHYIEVVCEQFEQRWRENSGFRIEDYLKSLQVAMDSFPIDDSRVDVDHAILDELIHVEMDLRHELGEKFDRFEYYLRFPEFVAVIDKSIDRINRLDSNVEIELTKVVIKSSRGGDEKKADEWKVDVKGHVEIPESLGQYSSINKVGAGGFGVVCSAIDKNSGEKFALKFPRKRVIHSDELLKSFVDEANRAKQLKHPGIVKTYGVKQIDGFITIVQQLVQGTDLKASARKPRTQREIAELTASVADALGYAGRMGIVHRDLKPANILLDESGQPLITDFGLALDESVQFDLPNQRCGTPLYMSPQLVAGLTRNLDGRTDIWSLGVILYELLTGRRPFQGKTEHEIYQQIETRDPKPLRQIDSEIDKELERICLKCLSRQARDRYLTADDLADDLRHWIENGQISSSKKQSAKLIPKGLRSYGSEDSEFFLSLLPGPKDRDGIPASIRFWKIRICEPVDDEHRTPVGIIYGPSGSGKSSFVKAGLIPQLTTNVKVVYLEATPSSTESQIIKQLKNEFAGIPDGTDLQEVFSGLGHRRWQTNNKKILVVIDQFEQRLSRGDEFDRSELAKALRHCDGQNIQCLLLVRDDFWLALTRFIDALEMDLLEGRNAQDIDLFDREHAKKVLVELGRAYGRLPDDSTELNKDQSAFIEQAIDQLAVGNYVICVRLTLFAEMFKSRPWTRSQLKEIRGLHGVGERFLDETFGLPQSPARFRIHDKAVRAILEALLPSHGSDIRGGVQSESFLKLRSTYGNRDNQFSALMKILDQDLKLISLSELNFEKQTLNDEFSREKKNSGRYFQLTHDYLVPSIRNWISTKLRETWTGRNLLRYRDISSSYSSKLERRFLPSFFEYLTFLVFVSKTQKKETKEFWGAASKKAAAQFGIAIFALLIIFVGLGVAYKSYRKNRISEHLSLAIGCEPQAFPLAADQLKSDKILARQLLSQMELTSTRNKLHRQLLFVELECCEDYCEDTLIDSIEKAEIGEFDNILQSMKKLPNEKKESLLRCLKKRNFDSAVAVETRIRYSVLAFFLGDPSSAEEIVSDMTNPDLRSQWIHEFRNWRPNLAANKQILNHLPNVNLKEATCLGIGLVNPSELTQHEKEFLEEFLTENYLHSSNAALHNSSKWAKKQIFGDSEIFRNEYYPKHGNWYIDKFGLSFVRVDPKTFDTKYLIEDKEYFVLDTEVPVWVYEIFLAETGKLGTISTKKSPSPNCPVQNVTLIQAMEFCNWLSQRSGKNSCYILKDDVWCLDANANGYRLPTTRENKDFFNAGAITKFFFGNDEKLEFFATYVTSLYNSGIELITSECCSRAPNPLGLFDTFGNVSEWCWIDNQFQVNRKGHPCFGGNFEIGYSMMLQPRRLMPDNSRWTIGFRVVTDSSPKFSSVPQ